MFFRDRNEAGLQLSKKLKGRNLVRPIVLALPRGGVPVAAPVAQSLHAPLDVLVVRKVGAPGHEEFGIGAVTENGHFWLDPALLRHFGSRAEEIQATISRESKELQRRVDEYRGGRKLPNLNGRDVILVDDGLATGVTARVAAKFVKDAGARRVILSVPVCSASSAEALSAEVDEVVCLDTPEPFFAVGQFYGDFSQVTDGEVLATLCQFREGHRANKDGAA